MVDRILGGLYLSSYDEFVREGDVTEKHGITHIVTVFKGTLPADYYDRFEILSIEVDDDEASDIIQYFPKANKFINDALFPDEVDGFLTKVKKPHQTSVAVLCQAGMSRSPTILSAYLMKKYGLNVEQSLHAIQRKRERKVKPNDNFMEQLELYYDSGCVFNLHDSEYRQWKLQNSVKSDPTGRSFLSGGIAFNDEDVNEEEELQKLKDNQELIQLKCKKCRYVLCNSNKFIYHLPPGDDSKQSKFIRRVPNKRKIISIEAASSTCSHHFVEPILWMKPELEKSEVEGKFNCPKCETKIGGYSWRGSRCSCGKWMIPSLHIQRAKVDAFKLK
jgi:dual specificity phosphatase 12